MFLLSSNLDAGLVRGHEYLGEDAVVVDLHGHDCLVGLDLAQHISCADLVSLLELK